MVLGVQLDQRSEVFDGQSFGGPTDSP